MASDWLAASLPANQKPWHNSMLLQLVNMDFNMEIPK